MMKNQVKIAKIDEARHIIKGVVYKPYEKDSQDDWMTKEEIAKAAYNFMKNLRLREIDTKHDLETVDAFVCESSIAKENDPDGYKEGSWIVCIKIDDDDIWAGVLRGDYEGLSMYGKCNTVDDSEPPSENIE